MWRPGLTAQRQKKHGALTKPADTDINAAQTASWMCHGTGLCFFSEPFCVSSVSQVSADGALTESSMPLAVFTSRAPASGPDVERVSTGTKFALELWLRSLDVPDL